MTGKERREEEGKRKSIKNSKGDGMKEIKHTGKVQSDSRHNEWRR